MHRNYGEFRDLFMRGEIPACKKRSMEIQQANIK